MLDIAPLKFPESEVLQSLSRMSIAGIAAFKGRRAALEAALGLTLPHTPRRVAHGTTNYLWNGHDAWLAMSETPALLENLTTVAAKFAAITDQSDGFVAFRVSGFHRRAILKKLVPIDLHQDVFAPDAVALTLAGQLPVKLWMQDDGSFALAGLRSFSRALHHALEEAAREFVHPGHD
ncbi:MAG: sarcosine oxidase subunit gamma family protein [Acidiphilium sp.]|nr:sarcosine oxidase subunit gamma family protein [Acidiphilium sp.]MDD4936212.1 sarcosine oxidase subunit gamma family protein [Acidiphilium sp.]